MLRQQGLPHGGRRRFARAQAEMKDWTQRKEPPLQGCCPGQRHACVCGCIWGGWVLGNSVLVRHPASYPAAGPGLQEEPGGLKGLTCQVGGT